MHPGPGHMIRERVQAVRSWPAWNYSRWLVAYIAIVVGGYLVALAMAARVVPLSESDLILFGGLLACSATTVELTRRAGENAGLGSDVYAVWELPVAILLPPLYALAVPILRIALAQWRIRPLPLHRRVFTAAVVGLSYGAASLAFHGIGSGLGLVPNPGIHGSLWVLAVAAAALVQWTVNTGLVLPAIKGGEPGVRVRELLLAREVVRNDVAEHCVAVLVTFSVAISPLAILFALPFVTLLQRSVRHAQLLSAARHDSKTGLLNAGTWEREAATEIARAVRTRTPVALALIDVDHFKAVNDAYGHLAGDKALKAIARTFKIFVREYDLVGRFGGEEFALLLPHTRAVDAYRIAERIREHIAVMPVEMGSGPDEMVRVTVSMGVAALGTRWDNTTGNQLTDLLAAADRALYQAKRDGRDRVCVVTDATTISTPTETTTQATRFGCAELAYSQSQAELDQERPTQ